MTEPFESAREEKRSDATQAPILSLNGQPVFGTGTEPDDDAPTIISRPGARPARPEDRFADQLRGRRIAHFELIEPIGVGGMAAVIRAQDMQLDRTVALKILPPEMAVDPENIRRFHQEARAAAKLDHENIARVFFCGEDQGLHFIAFEFVEGDNLRIVLERRRRVPVAEAIHYMLQIATGIAHAASRGVVHRDIKPSNIIIGPNGRAKLVDMGLARSLQPFGDMELTQSGVTLGTFDYISPEQALEPRQADVRSDIYSLGCTFYQMLTGQSPVPDGTAARKLHHHQHVAPTDPRQLNPAIPDDLAAILARMMAKDPRDRYQKPEHLVQHLLHLARQLGGTEERPESVLYVDAPLPQPPRMRPLLVAVAAGVLLVLVVVLHGMSSWSDQAPRGLLVPYHKDEEPGKQSRFEERQPNPASKAAAVKDQPAPTPPAVARKSPRVATIRELTTLLNGKEPRLDVHLLNDLDLKHEPGDAAGKVPGLVFQGADRELTLQPNDPNRLLTIRLAYDADLRDGEEGVPLWSALTVKGAKVTLRRLRFEVNARQAPRLLMTALRLQESGQLILERCEFVQYNPPAAGRLSDVLVEGFKQAQPRLTAHECCFLGGFHSETTTESGFVSGQEAIALAGNAQAQLNQCAFGPHASVVSLRERGSQDAAVSLRNCSVLLTDGCVVSTEDRAGVRLTVENSLFVHPEAQELSGAPARAALLRQQGTGDLRFTGSRNRYFNLPAFCVRDHAVVAANHEEFLGLKESLITDDHSEPLCSNPFVDLAPLRSLELNLPQRAFLAHATWPELRQTDPNRMVGVETCSWGATYAATLPAVNLGTPELLSRIVVDPSAQEPFVGRTYKLLESAVMNAKSGSVIYVKHSGLLKAKPMPLEKAALELTIRPFPGYQPILTLGDTTDPDAAIFRIHDGKLRLEQVDILLRPQLRDFKAQSVVGMAGLGHCTLKHCYVTLDAGVNEDVPLTLFALADPKDVMRMDSPPVREVPELRLDHCVVRGKGDLVGVRASRPFELKIDQSLLALAGTLLVTEGNTKDPSPTPAVQISLTRVTAHLMGHFALLKTSKNLKDLVPLQVRSSESLFSSSGEHAFIRVAGETTEDQVKRFLTWDGTNNVYSSFKALIDQLPRGDDMEMPPFAKDKWLAAFSDRSASFERVRFEVAPMSEASLKTLLPSQLRVLDGDGRYGADITRLPLPAVETRPPGIAPSDD